MTIQHSSFQPCCTIIPPHMIKKIKKNCDNKDLRVIAKRNIRNHKQLRAKRAEIFCGKRKATCKTAKNTIVKVYNSRHKKSLPGVKILDPWNSPDVEVREANEWAQKTYEFYCKEFKRNSINDEGMTIKSSTHFGKDYDNAFWDGEQMVYGDGDGKIFTRFTIDPDVGGHEMTHGVTQYRSSLVYSDQSGALNESLSDVFGIMVKQYIYKQTAAQSNWLIGENVIKRENCALRSMKAPGTAYVNHPQLGTDPQPATMDQYRDMKGDNGGVHINSGIPNKAFYEAAKNLSEINPEKFAFAWQGAGQVWYKASSPQRIKPTANFADFANATITVADEFFGKNTKESSAIRYAWKAVKIYGQKPAPVPPEDHKPAPVPSENHNPTPVPSEECNLY